MRLRFSRLLYRFGVSKMRHHTKVSLVLLFCLLIGSFAPLHAALPSNTAWEVRTAGSNNNGGCYVTGSTGTDFTQQNSAQYTGTDLVLATTTTATSVFHSFIATDVGNCIHITAGTGFTVGFYRMLSVSLGTVTLDRAAGTMGSTGGTFAVGGAIATPQMFNSNAVAGNQAWIKADGSYVFTATMAIDSKDSSGLTPFRFTGYTTTRGDNGYATWTTSTNSVNMVTTANSQSLNVEFDNIKMTNTAGTKGDAFNAANVNGFGWMINHCVLDGFNIGINGDYTIVFAFNVLSVVNTEIKNSVAQGILNAASTSLLGDYIHANGGNGVEIIRADPGTQPKTNGIMSVSYSTLSANGGSGLKLTRENVADSNYDWAVVTSSVLSLNTADGLTLGSITIPDGLVSWNTIYYGNGGFGINSGGVPMPANQLNNAFGSNTSGNRSTNIPSGIGDISLSANPWTNSTAGDFSLNSTSGGGASLKGTGFPGVSLFGTGHLDVGSLQSAGSSGGSSSVVGIAQ